jgi:hypothetical protein
MILDAGLGNPQGDGPYRKPWGGLGAGQGAVYVVCGCSGEGGRFNYPRHPAMARNLSGYGSVVVDVEGLRLTARFLTEVGAVEDLFAIDKSAPEPMVRPRLEVERGAGGLRLQWPTSIRSYAVEASATNTGSWPAAGLPGGWQTVGGSILTTGRQHRLEIPAGGEGRVFRLRSIP